jgi:hypothetical protein
MADKIEKDNEELKALIQELKTELNNKKKVDTDKKAEEDKKAKQPEEQVTDFSKMTPEQFYAHVKAETVKEMSEALKPFFQQVMALTYTSDRHRVSAKDKTFTDYEKDVQEIMTKNPSLDMDDALILAKAKNPPKTEDIPAKKDSVMKSLFAVESKVEDKEKAEVSAKEKAWLEVMGEETEIK